MEAEPRVLVDGLLEAWQSLSHTDVSVVCADGAPVRCHRVVLACLSPMLEAALRSDLMSVMAEDSCILLPDVSSTEWCQLLTRVYGGADEALAWDELTRGLGMGAASLGVSPLQGPRTRRESDGPTLNAAEAVVESRPALVEATGQSIRVATPDSQLLAVATGPDAHERILEWFKLSRQKTFATCRECEKKYKHYPGSSHKNLLKHLTREHPELVADKVLADPLPTDPLLPAGIPPTGSPHSVWQHFNRLGETKAACTLCSARPITLNPTEPTLALIRHLTARHPLVDLDLAGGPLAHSDLFEAISVDLIRCVACLVELKVVDHHRDLVARDHLRLFHVNELGKENLDDGHWNPSVLDCFTPNAATGLAQCQTCLAHIASGSTGLMHNMLEHLTDHHPNLFPGTDATHRKVPSTTSSTPMLSGFSAQDMQELAGLMFEHDVNETFLICKTCSKSFESTNLDEPLLHACSDHPDLLTECIKSHNLKPKTTRGTRKRCPVSAKEQVAKRTCQVCHKIFSRAVALQAHEIAVHSGKRPFKCDMCDATFARKESYLRHGHVNNRPFLCSVCGNTFARRHIRDIHERAHHGDKRYGCSFCEKRFVTNQKKTIHERIHTGEKPFKCLACGKCFVQKHQLATHSRIHTGARPYKCDVCQQMFRHLSTRAKHNCVGIQEVQKIYLTNSDKLEDVSTVEIYSTPGETETIIIKEED